MIVKVLTVGVLLFLLYRLINGSPKTVEMPKPKKKQKVEYTEYEEIEKDL